MPWFFNQFGQTIHPFANSTTYKYFLWPEATFAWLVYDSSNLRPILINNHNFNQQIHTTANINNLSNSFIQNQLIYFLMMDQYVPKHVQVYLLTY